MGADSLMGFDHWERWEEIANTMPIAVMDRAGLEPDRAGLAGSAYARTLAARRAQGIRARALEAARLGIPARHEIAAFFDGNPCKAEAEGLKPYA